MTDNDNTGMFSRRKLLIGGGAAALAVTAVAGCKASNSGSAIGDTVADMNDLVNQQQNLTVQAYNRVKDNPECQYPSSLLTTSLELASQRKKLLRFNEASKVGWIHLFSNGVYIGKFSVLGKVSSCQSSMTSNTGVFIGDGTSGRPTGDNVPVDMPGDDISFGSNEDGVFWFTVEGIYMNWSGQYLYVDTELDVKLEPGMVQPANAQPTKSAA